MQAGLGTMAERAAMEMEKGRAKAAEAAAKAEAKARKAAEDAARQAQAKAEKEAKARAAPHHSTPPCLCICVCLCVFGSLDCNKTTENALKFSSILVFCAAGCEYHT